MAGKMFTLDVQITHGASAKTIAQFLVANNSRVKLHSIAIQPRGQTAATAPLRWKLGTQTTSGTATTSTLIKVPPVYSYALVTTAEHNHTVEPSGFAAKWNISLHQQGTFLWTPPSGPLILESGERWGLVYSTGQASNPDVDYQFLLEE